MILPSVVLEVGLASRWLVSSVGRKSNIYFIRERDRRCWIGKTDKRAIKQEFLGDLLVQSSYALGKQYNFGRVFPVKVYKRKSLICDSQDCSGCCSFVIF